MTGQPPPPPALQTPTFTKHTIEPMTRKQQPTDQLTAGMLPAPMRIQAIPDTKQTHPLTPISDLLTMIHLALYSCWSALFSCWSMLPVWTATQSWVQPSLHSP